MLVQNGCYGRKSYHSIVITSPSGWQGWHHNWYSYLISRRLEWLGVLEVGPWLLLIDWFHLLSVEINSWSDPKTLKEKERKGVLTGSLENTLYHVVCTGLCLEGNCHECLHHKHVPPAQAPVCPFPFCHSYGFATVLMCISAAVLWFSCGF